MRESGPCEGVGVAGVVVRIATSGLCFGTSALKRAMCMPNGTCEGGGGKPQGEGVSPTLEEGAEGGTERAKHSGGLQKRSAEDWEIL